MRQTTIITIATLLCAALSGCLVGGDPKETTSSSAAPTSSSGTSSPSPTNTSGSANKAPEADAVVLVNGTAPAPVNGSIPLDAGKNVTFDASNSTDADDDELTFSWDFGDGNTSTNATAVYAYSTAGNYTVTLEVSDGMASDELTLNVTVAAGGAARVEVSEFSGSILIGSQGPDSCGTIGEEGIDIASFEWVLGADDPAGTMIYPITVAMVSGGEATVDLDLFLYDAEGNEVASAVTGEPDETIEHDDPIPAGTYTITVVGCVAVEASFDITATATINPA